MVELIILVVVLVIVLALILRSSVSRNHELQPSVSETNSVYQPTKTGSHEADADAYWDQQLPLSPAPADYLDAAFAHRYRDAFVYYPTDPNYLYKVYPLCCEMCKRNAYAEISKVRKVSQLPIHLTAKILQIQRYSEPPRNQGQASDRVTYVAMKMERLPLFPILRELTAQALARLISGLAELAKQLGIKVRDLSIANVGRRSDGSLGIQHLDDTSRIEAGDVQHNPSLNSNLFYNRYNVLKHIPKTSFATRADFTLYQTFLVRIEQDTNHLYHAPEYARMLSSG